MNFSWKGNEECFIKNRKNLDLALGGGSLSWKRDNQKGGYPLHVRYKPKFVVFNEKLIAKDVGNDSAFLHLFFLSPLNAEDYRYNVRPIVSEWFARLNEAQVGHWIIVYDSSKMKEKKVRNIIWERLRSDFAKFSTRLIEINAASSASEKSAFFSLVQSTLVSAFNTFVDALSAAIQRLKNDAVDKDVTELNVVPRIVNLQYKLCQFYWNLGLMEDALHELDNIDKYLTLMLSGNVDNERIQSNTTPVSKWLKRTSSSPFGASCAYLGALMCRNAVDEENASLAELRAFVLAHQVLITFYMFYQRYVVMVGNGDGGNDVSLLFGENLVDSTNVVPDMKRSPEPESTPDEQIESTNVLAVQLCQNFVSFVLRYTHDALTHLMEDLAPIEAHYGSTLLHALTLVWHDEIFACCNCLGDILRMENASYFICQLTCLQCDALIKLLTIFTDHKRNTTDLKVLRRWFEAESVVVETCQPTTSTFRHLAAVFFDNALAESDGIRFDEFAVFVEERLIKGVEIFRNYKYIRHVETFNLQLIDLFVARKAEPRKIFERVLENYKISLEGKSLHSFVEYASRIVTQFPEFTSEYSQTFADCLFLLTTGEITFAERLFTFLNTFPKPYIKCNRRWKLSQRFPLYIYSISDNFLQSDLHSNVSLKVLVKGEFLREKFRCIFCDKKFTVRAVLKLISSVNLESARPIFDSRTIATSERQILQRLVCLSAGHSFFDVNIENDFSGTISDEELNVYKSESLIFFHLSAISEKILSEEENVIQFEFAGKANIVGCFALDHLVFDFCEKFSIYLDYQMEIARSKNGLNNVFCFISTKSPHVSISTHHKSQNCYLAGVAQKICLELNVGTASTNAPTSMNVSLVATKSLMHFLCETDDKWHKEASFVIPAMHSEETLLLDVIFCLNIDRMNFSADQSLTLHCDLRVDWLGKTWYFPVNFLPIINIKSMTSLLGDCVLFEVDIQRCDSFDGLRILPQEAVLLQDQSVAKDLVEAILLNPMPFQPIVANSSHRFVWRLPNSKISKSIPITHFIRLSYFVEVDYLNYSNNHFATMPAKEIVERAYIFENKLTFAVQRVEYEVCAHILSERPQSVLCRMDLSCDLIVSLRSLSQTMPESIIVVVEVDPQFWTAIDKFKVVHIKGSGIGQTSFTIIPKLVGFLPYPNIFVHRYISTDENDRRSFNETTFIGERLNSFYRNHGKQVHVLGHLHAADDTSSVSSVATMNSTGMKKSLKSQAKDKIQKLFELKD